jgi:hypothetical protein
MACNASAPSIVGNEFFGNIAPIEVVDGFGGAIDLVAGSSPHIQNNIFRENGAVSGGGAVRCFQSSPTILNNTFIDNSAGLGAGILCDNVSLPVIRNNTFDANENVPAGASEIYCDNFSDPQIYNNIIVGSGGAPVEGANNSRPEIGCCNFYGNAGGNSLPANSIDREGNISADPLFCGAESGNYHLQRRSPCAGIGRDASCAVMGAFGVACSGVDHRRYADRPASTSKAEHKTWGAIKLIFRDD